MQLFSRVKASLLDGQYGHPTGVVGHLLGGQMVRQHEPETTWTLALLHLKSEDQVLEIGFGAGKALELAVKQANRGHVYGIDISQTMLRAASRRNAEHLRTGRLTMRQGDVTTLPFAEQQFDKVFSIQSFYFWPDPLRALAEVLRVLKPGGLLVITLSTGTTDPQAATGLEQYQLLLEEQMIPGMLQLGFAEASIKQGPPSRHFKTTALIGTK